MLIENMNKSLTKPEMIIFDCGHTLLYEPNHSKTNANGMNYGVLIWHWLIQTKLRSILVQHVHQKQEIQKLMLTTLLSHWRKLEALN